MPISSDYQIFWKNKIITNSSLVDTSQDKQQNGSLRDDLQNLQQIC